MKFKKLKESLDFNKQADLNSRIYKAVASAIFDSGMLDVTANDVTTAFNEFNKRFFNESLNESVDESTKQDKAYESYYKVALKLCNKYGYGEDQFTEEITERVLEDNGPNLSNKEVEEIMLDYFEDDFNESLDGEKEFKAFKKKHPNYNKNFDNKKYGKFFDKNGKLKPEFEKEFWSKKFTSINEDVDESTKREIFDYLDDLGGYTDYNGKIESVADEFGLSQEEAEGIVWDWSINIDPDDDDDEEDDEETSWIKVISKPVPDSDGFLTDYTMYRDINDENHYVFVFGDNDIYKPEDGDWDYEAFSNSEATEWYNNYEGFTEEDEE